jgi:hypothetical protein
MWAHSVPGWRSADAVVASASLPVAGPGIPGASAAAAPRVDLEVLMPDNGDSPVQAITVQAITAELKSTGIPYTRVNLNDANRERYGCRNSFVLAEELYGRVERAHPEPAGPPPHDPWRIGLLGCLPRGVVFALPGPSCVLGAPLLAGPHDGFGLPAGPAALPAGALRGWMWNQGPAHRAYSWLGLGDRDACRRTEAAAAAGVYGVPPDPDVGGLARTRGACAHCAVPGVGDHPWGMLPHSLEPTR